MRLDLKHEVMATLGPRLSELYGLSEGRGDDDPPRRAGAAPGLLRHAAARLRVPHPRSGRPRGGARGDRRDRLLRRLGDAALPRAPRADARGHLARRSRPQLRAHRRHRPHGRGRLPVRGRPQEGHDHLRRLQHLPRRHRSRPFAASGRARRVRRRRRAPALGRISRRRRHPAARRRGRRAGAQGLGERAAGEDAARGRRAAAQRLSPQRHGQGGQARPSAASTPIC
jgi:hypothetical protein